MTRVGVSVIASMSGTTTWNIGEPEPVSGSRQGVEGPTCATGCHSSSSAEMMTVQLLV